MDTLVLSRRNLLVLLNKLDDLDSYKTIVKTTEEGNRIFVKVAEDEEIYKGREPGSMLPKHLPKEYKNG